MQYYIGKRTVKDGVSKWEKINVGEYRITKPTIFCIGGNNTISDKEANYMAKFVQQLIGNEEEVDYLSLRYSCMPGFNNGYLSSNEESEIVKKLFLPLVLDDQNQPLPCEEACKNMRNLNIMGHCFGAREAVPDLERTLMIDLYVLGYSEEEVSQIVSQVFVASFVGGSPYVMKTFSVKSIDDCFYANEYVGELIWSRLDKIQLDPIDRVILTRFREKAKTSKSHFDDCKKFLASYKYIMLREENQLDLITAKLSTNDDDHNIQTLQRGKEWEPFYTSSRIGDIASKTLAYALASAVANSIINTQSSELIPVDLAQMQIECNEIVFDMRPPYIKAKLAKMKLPQEKPLASENERKKEE